MNNIIVSVVIPSYNEEGNIVTLLKETHHILHSIGVTHELIVVDDASEDKTRYEVKELKKTIPQIVLIERNNERGLATALIRGYNEARVTYLGSMDADLAHHPKYLVDMIKILESQSADFVIGSRYLPTSHFEGKPLIHKITSLVGQYVVRIILNLKIKDTSNNYRLFRRKIWEKIKNNLHADGNIMITEIAYLAEKNGFRIKEIPIVYIERRIGKSKLSIIKEAKKFFKNIVKIKLQK